MIFYNKDKDGDPIAYIRCDCGTHGIQLQKITFKEDTLPSDIYITFYTDSYYYKQTSFLKRWKTKIAKIFLILRGKEYKVDDELVLSQNDLEKLISTLQEYRDF